MKELCEFKLIIEEPIVKKVDSCGRIDIPIFDKQFVVVIENKITDKALDQNNENGGQLARYIEAINQNHSRTLAEIFLVYTPKFRREPSDECWKNKDDYSYKENFEERFRSLSFKDVIYPWLKHEILPNIDEKNTHLRSAAEQYIDHLEGEKMFNLRNENMNKKLQKFIKEELAINNVEPEIALEIVTERLQDLDNAKVQLQTLQVEIQNEIDLKYFSNCYSELKELDLEVVNKIDSYPDYYPKSVGVKLNNNLIIWLGESKDDGFFCQVNKINSSEKFPQKVNQLFKQIFVASESIDERKESAYFICAYLNSRENALAYLKEFCVQMSQI